jgi:hypothetical protein
MRVSGEEQTYRNKEKEEEGRRRMRRNLSRVRANQEP